MLGGRQRRRDRATRINFRAGPTSSVTKSRAEAWSEPVPSNSDRFHG
jgi:hypothetical protein